MGGRWSTEQVLALAPDAASSAAARKLAGPGPWRDTGAAGTLVWGYCAGSGKTPYQAAVDLDGPAYRCSCPSRKFPCKHALGLLLLWSADGVPDAAEPAQFAGEWKSGRVQRAERAASTPAGERDEAAAAKRSQQRAERVAAGLAELDLWLRDQVQAGITAAAGGYGHVEPVAARMVDAQAPGVAGSVRALGGIAGTGEGWPARLLAGYARLHLLVRAHQRLDDLPPELVSTVRAHVGYPTAKESVLASTAIDDRWHVLARTDVLDAAVPTRRTWLRGRATGRDALLLAFDPRGSFGADPDATLAPGTQLEAGAHFYPGAPALRALLGARRGEPTAAAPPTAESVAMLLDRWAGAIEHDPWLTAWPAVLHGIPVSTGDGWLLAESAEVAVPLAVADPWLLHAVAGGHPVPVAGEWDGRSFRPLTVWDGATAVSLT